MMPIIILGKSKEFFLPKGLWIPQTFGDTSRFRKTVKQQKINTFKEYACSDTYVGTIFVMQLCNKIKHIKKKF